MPALVYVLCALTSLACTGLLLRSYSQKKLRLLLWSGLAFLALALSNVVLFIDLVLLPQVDLAIWRNLLTLSGVLLLLRGLTDASPRP